MNEIAKLYIELGALSLIAVVFIWLAIKNEKATSKKYDLLFSKLLDKKPISEEENKMMTKMEIEINKYIKKLMESTKADRVYLMRYHNGGKDLLGNSFLKMSMTNEVSQIGIHSVSSIFKDQFRGTFLWIIKPLEKHDYIYSATINDKYKTEAVAFLNNRGVKEMHCIGIENDKGTTIGFIGAEFILSEASDMEQLNHCLYDKKIKVETLLNINDKYN